MKRLLPCLFAVFLLTACKKGKPDPAADKRDYFLKIEVGPHAIDISMTDAQMADSAKKIGGYEEYVYAFRQFTQSNFTYYFVEIINKNNPQIDFTLGLPSPSKGSYEPEFKLGVHLGLYLEVNRKLPNGDFLSQYAYQTNKHDGTNSPLTMNITESTSEYIEGDFNGIVHGQDYTRLPPNGLTITVPIKGSFRVKRDLYNQGF